MKTTLIDQEFPSEPQFPLIARDLDTDIIVLFTSAEIGTVIHTTNYDYDLGEYGYEWVSVFDTGAWQILPEITIKFESYNA